MYLCSTADCNSAERSLKPICEDGRVCKEGNTNKKSQKVSDTIWLLDDFT